MERSDVNAPMRLIEHRAPCPLVVVPERVSITLGAPAVFEIGDDHVAIAVVEQGIDCGSSGEK